MNGILKHWKTWTALIIVFASGVSIGITANKMLTTPNAQPTPATPALKDAENSKPVGRFQGCGNSPRMMRERLSAHFFKQLSLSPEQKEKVAPILKQMTQRIETVNKSKYPEIQKIITEEMEKIDAVLSPEQKNKLASLKKHILSRGKCRRNAKNASSKTGCSDKERQPKHQGWKRKASGRQ